jgi:hypothetical protein
MAYCLATLITLLPGTSLDVVPGAGGSLGFRLI